jgi:hypothetical protein
MTGWTAGFYTERRKFHKILLSHILVDMFEENGQNLSDILYVTLAWNLGNAVFVAVLG